MKNKPLPQRWMSERTNHAVLNIRNKVTLNLMMLIPFLMFLLLPTLSRAVTCYFTFNDYACFASRNPGKTPGHVTIIRSTDGNWMNGNNIGCGWADISGNVTNLAINCGSTGGYFFFVFNNNDYMQATGVTTSPCDFYTATGYINGTGSFNVTASCTMPDVTAPVIQSGATNTTGTEITLTYSEDISASYPWAEDFTVKVNSVTRSVSTVTYSGTSCVLTISPAVLAGETVTVSYDNAYEQIVDNSSNAAVSLTNYPITNNATGSTSTSTITFDAAGGSAVSPITQVEGSAVTAPANPTRSGYTFQGWVPAVPATMPVDDLTCVAQWQQNTSTITFNSSGGSSVSPITQVEGSAVTAPANPTRSGYTFQGWVPAVPATMPVDDLTCVAQWQQNTSTITFNSSGGSSVSPITQVEGSAVTPPADPTRSGYIFDGWTPAVPATMPVDDLTCIAQWHAELALSCPENYNMNADQNVCTASVSFAANASGTPTPTITYTVNSNPITSPYNFPTGITTVNVSATNGPETKNCSFTVTVTDNQPPVVNCPADLTVNTDPGKCYAIVTYLGTPAATDNCGLQSTNSNTGAHSFTNNAPVNKRYNVGTTTVTWTVYDKNGNMAQCTQTITVKETEPPTINCPSTITANVDPGHCYATINNLGTPQTGDNCAVQNVNNDAPGNNQYPVGNTTIIWTVIDVNNNSTTCKQTITVTDNEPPSISCPPTQTAHADPGKCYATIPNLGTPQTGDNCGVLNVTNTAPVNNQYPMGTTTVTWTITDVHNNSTTCKQVVTVTDNQPPTITCPATVTAYADQDQCYATITTLGTAQTSDNCWVQSVSNNAPVNNQYPVGNTTITWTAIDVNNNISTCKQTVTVTDNQPPVVTCPATITATTDQGQCYATILNLGTPQTGDNCGIQNVSHNAPLNNQYATGSTTVTWTITDVNNNVATCRQTITVTENQPPVLVCPEDVHVCTDATNSPVVVNNLAPIQAYDNCGPVTLRYQITGATTANGNTDASGTLFNLGISQVKYTVEDQYGNSSSCSFEVTVHALPEVLFSGDYSAVPVCTSPFQLSGASPVGGTYSGNYVTSNTFYPNLSGLGTFNVIYTYTNVYGCTNTIDFSVTIAPPLDITYTIGSGGDFPNLTGNGGLFEFLNTSTVGGNITAQVISNLDEPGTHALNPMVFAHNCLDFTLTLVPSAAVVHVISGNVAQALIRLDGADRVTFDGTVFSGKHFLFRNNDNTKPVILLINGATFNQFKGCVVEGANNDEASGLVVLSTSTGPQGNSSNTFTRCIFRNRSDVSTLPANLVYSNGTSSCKNSSNQFTGSEFINFGQQAVSVTATGNGNNWNISGNSFYFTLNPITAANQTGILFLAGNTSMNHVFNNNYFGGSAPALGGTASNHNAAGTFKAFSVNSGDASISGNQIGNISLSNTGAAQFIGIETNGNGNFLIGSNIVDNITVAGTGNFTGLNGNGSGTATFSTNRISNITYTSSTGVPIIKGIVLKKGSAVKNGIYSIKSTSTHHTPTIYGISNMAVSLSAPNPIENNMISLDAGISSKPKIYGLYDYSTGIGGQYRHNTVRLYGPTTNSYWTAAFYRQGNADVTLYNNILVNHRISNNLARHYAIYTVSTLLWTSNYNNLFTASSTIGVWGVNTGNTFLSWKAISGQDMNSINVNPVFVSATDLHLTTANSALDNKGIGLFSVLTDIDGSPRNLATPDMGAHEFTAIQPREDNPLSPGLNTETAFSLNAYPNPFSTNTILEINLTRETKVTLKVYTLLGEELSSLVEGFLPEGLHTFNFKSTELSPGIYLCQLRTDDGKVLIKRLEKIR